MNCFPALVLVPISSISVRLPSGVSASLPPVMLPMLTVLSAASVTVR